MSVTGWSNGGLRSWGSTTGDETGTIVADNGSGQTGFLTRDQNNGIGDFEFTSTISCVTNCKRLYTVDINCKCRPYLNNLYVESCIS